MLALWTSASLLDRRRAIEGYTRDCSCFSSSTEVAPRPDLHGQKDGQRPPLSDYLSLASDNSEHACPTHGHKIIYATNCVHSPGGRRAKARRTKSWRKFKDFVMNMARNPVSRQLTLMCEYEDAQQGLEPAKTLRLGWRTLGKSF